MYLTAGSCLYNRLERLNNNLNRERRICCGVNSRLKETKKMKKIGKIVALTLSLMFASPFAACGENGEKVDLSKSQLTIGYFNAGYGPEWMAEAERMFEEKFKDVELEPGKKGVQVWVNYGKDEYKGWNFVSAIQGREEDVYVGCELFYSLQNPNILMDLSKVVREPLTEFGETQSIYDKMTEEAKRACYWTEDETVPIFSTIFAESYFGQLTYDIDLFETKGYYLAEDGGWTKGTEGARKKTVGFDGIEGTYDDGLPETETQFFDLLTRIRSYGDIPLTWSGINSSYPIAFATQISVNYDDAKSQEIWRTGYGDYTLLHKNADGTYALDDEPTVFDGANNFYENARFPGKLAALRSVYRLIKDSNYYSSKAYGTTQTHIKAQNEFLTSVLKDQSVAMLIEGNWWETEASAIFQEMSNEDEKYSAQNRRFGVMPLFKPDGNTATKHTYMTGYSPIFVNARTDTPELSKLFVKFLASDECLKMFTRVSGVPMGYNYELAEGTYENLTCYKKQVWDIHVDKYDTHILTSENRTEHPMFKINASDYPYAFSSNVNDPKSTTDPISDPFSFFKTDLTGKTAEDYFDGMWTYAKLIAAKYGK